MISQPRVTSLPSGLTRRLAVLALTEGALAGLIKTPFPNALLAKPIAFSMVPAQDPNTKMNGLNQLGWDLFRKLTDDNLFFSPTSIGLALAMAEMGARGDTGAQMRKILHSDPLKDQGGQDWRTVIDLLGAEKPGRQVRIASRLFGQQDYGFLPEYTSLLKQLFNAPLEEVDFRGNSEGARIHINKFILEQTRNRIKDLVPSGALTEDTRLVLVNAIHFKGDWLVPFAKNATLPAPFETTKGNSMFVPRMNCRGKFVIRETPYAECLEFPFEGYDRSVYFLLPKKRHGLAMVEKLTGSRDWNSLLFSSHDPEMVHFHLPRFKLESTLDISKVLQILGMTLAFNKNADFSGINGGKKPLKIDNILHKAVLEIDETGAVAVAATITRLLTAAPSPPKPREPRTFLVDQPFLVVITDKSTKGVLFLGRVVKPQSY